MLHSRVGCVTSFRRDQKGRKHPYASITSFRKRCFGLHEDVSNGLRNTFRRQLVTATHMRTKPFETEGFAFSQITQKNIFWTNPFESITKPSNRSKAFITKRGSTSIRKYVFKSYIPCRNPEYFNNFKTPRMYLLTKSKDHVVSHLQQ